MKSVQLLHRLRSRPGAMLLATVLVIGATALIMSLTIARRGSNDISIVQNNIQATKALGLADGCIDEAMLQLSQNAGYTGSSTTTLGRGTCTISVSGSGSLRSVTVVATVDYWTRRILAKVRVDNPRIITAWRLLSE